MAKLIDRINKYHNSVMAEIKKIPVGKEDTFRGINYTSEQIEESSKEKKSFLDRYSNFVPKAEKILEQNKNEYVKKYEEWKKTEAPPKTSAKAKAVLATSIITSIIACMIPVVSMFFPAIPWLSAVSIPEILGGSILLSRYDTIKANINTDFNNWDAKGATLSSQIESVDRTIDTLHILKYRIEFYTNDDNIMANEWTFQSIKKEAELLMESVL